jgi:hypothetical protein
MAGSPESNGSSSASPVPLTSHPLGVEDGATSRSVTLARLILMFADGLERLDENFARTVARELDGKARHVRLPFIDRLGLEDVVVTLYMDRDMRLVVTGNHPTSFGAISARWDEEHFPFVEVQLLRDPVAEAYTFATLDFSVRGKKATLKRTIAPLPEGQTVTIRALATIGGSIEYRVVAMGQEVSASPEDVELI